MPGSEKPKFKLLSDAEFWKLPNGAKLQYLKTTAEHARRINGKPAARRAKKPK